MKYAKIIFVILAFISISAFFHFYFHNEGDPDVFYHFKHAEIYAEKGIFYNQFPWLPYTVIGQNNADQWYGFHLLLIPFTYFHDKIFGLKFAGVFITAAFLLMFYFALRILETGREFFWTLFMFFFTPPVMFHLLLIRPHALSAGLGALFFAMLVSGYGSAAIFAASFLLTWLHPNLFWLPVLIGGVVYIVNLTPTPLLRKERGEEKNPPLAFNRDNTKKFPPYEGGVADLIRLGGVISGGVLVGLLLTPNPIGTIKTIFIEVFGSPLASFSGVALNGGTELAPLAFKDFWIFLLFAVFWIAAFFIGYKNWAKIKPSIWASALLSAIFFLMSLFLVRRSMDLWIVFGTMFSAIMFKLYIEQNFFKQESKVALNSFLYLGASIMVIFGSYIYYLRMEQSLVDITDFQGAASWLENNSQSGDTVLNISWDQFPYLFFWDNKNYYTSGTDPYLLYAYDHELFRQSEEVRTGKATDIKSVLESFNSKFIFVTQNEADLFKKLLHDDNFEKGYMDRHVAVFRLKTN